LDFLKKEKQQWQILFAQKKGGGINE